RFSRGRRCREALVGSVDRRALPSDRVLGLDGFDDKYAVVISSARLQGHTGTGKIKADGPIFRSAFNEPEGERITDVFTGTYKRWPGIRRTNNFRSIFSWIRDKLELIPHSLTLRIDICFQDRV